MSVNPSTLATSLRLGPCMVFHVDDPPTAVVICEPVSLNPREFAAQVRRYPCAMIHVGLSRAAGVVGA